MKKTNLIYIFFVLLVIIFSTQCGKKTTTSNFGTYQVTVEPEAANLPALQSYALGVDSLGNWIIIGGRHNGLHNFNPPAFPANKANSCIYKINPQTWQVDSFPLIDLINTHASVSNALIMAAQFTATNIQHTQFNQYLYLCGGYGAIPLSSKNIFNVNYNYITYPVVSRVDLNKISTAITNKDANGILQSFAADINPNLAVTGGELFRMTDNNFYLTVGHTFNGEYGYAGDTTKPQPTQNYTRCIWKFGLIETDSTIKVDLTSLVSIPATPDSDSTSPLRRRDLVVVPSINPNNQFGLSIYGGVFTYTGSIGAAGNPWNYPIYITPGSSATYAVDSTYFQKSNLYSAANVLFYSSTTKTMYTSILGGLVDKDLDSNTNPIGNPASWTQNLLTIARTSTANGFQSTSIYDPNGMPALIGAEATFIPASNLQSSYYVNANYKILNYDALPSGTTFLGYMFGGITCDSVQSNPPSKPAYAINQVYKINFVKP
jgi:hypothetical protein